MAAPPCMHCTRCERDVAVEYQNSATARRWWRLYFLIPIFLLPASPMLASDFVVCLPLMMSYMVGMGPVLAIVREVPTCAECGALILAAEQSHTAARTRAPCVP
ncbi:hypothetical protein [Nannocystis bainbridge]|uniref:Uncharacterized protein n=1 Tax=Nannocystis bainbridge TaxID=2995303 RepID=A0ABT5EFH3_9BACT|nr:hypothetical protein [Nannocystis bainbridge]MDC0723693.1 hypothetical protein [Nannocystis bainbridge]